jgi:hypothetical protein
MRRMRTGGTRSGQVLFGCKVQSLGPIGQESGRRRDGTRCFTEKSPEKLSGGHRSTRQVIRRGGSARLGLARCGKSGTGRERIEDGTGIAAARRGCRLVKNCLVGIFVPPGMTKGSPAVMGDPFSHRGEKIPGNRRRADCGRSVSGPDTFVWVQCPISKVCGPMGQESCRRRDGTRCFTGKSPEKLSGGYRSTRQLIRRGGSARLGQARCGKSGTGFVASTRKSPEKLTHPGLLPSAEAAGEGGRTGRDTCTRTGQNVGTGLIGTRLGRRSKTFTTKTRRHEGQTWQFVLPSLVPSCLCGEKSSGNQVNGGTGQVVSPRKVRRNAREDNRSTRQLTQSARLGLARWGESGTGLERDGTRICRVSTRPPRGRRHTISSARSEDGGPAPRLRRDWSHPTKAAGISVDGRVACGRFCCKN